MTRRPLRFLSVAVLSDSTAIYVLGLAG